MSIANEIERLQNAKQAIKTSINNKGGTLTEDAKLDTFATAIDNLPSGGGGDNPLLNLVERKNNFSLTAEDLQGITQIGSQAFRDCSILTSIELPSSLKIIGSEAFRNCSILTSVELPSSLTNIDDKAFYNCSRLTSVELPSSLTNIGMYVFYNCSSLTSITIPSGVIRINSDTFYGCYNLTSVELPSSLTNISSNAFYGCSSLSSITIPSGVTSIGSYAFSGCSSLTSITIPSSVTSIGSYALSIGRSDNPATIKMISAVPPSIQSSTIGSYVNRIEVPMGLGDTYRSATNWAAKASIIVEV